MLQNNAALLPAREWLIPEDFFHSPHVHIFYQMLELAEAGTPIDLITVMDGLERAGDLEAIGGVAYLSSLADGQARVTNVEHYAKIVKEKAMLRHVIHTTNKLQLQALDSESSTEILDSAKARLNELTNLQPKVGLVSASQMVHESMPRLTQIFDGAKGLTGIASGYALLDSELAGMHKGELIVLAARPSHGKSALALNIAENLVLREKRTMAFFSLEMSRESLLLRMISSFARIDAQKFRSGHMLQDDMAKVMDACSLISSAPLWVDDSSSSTVGEIAARAERLRQSQGLELVIVDYLQLVAGAKRYGNRQEEVSDISRNLKALAKDLDVPVVALSQLKRTAIATKTAARNFQTCANPVPSSRMPMWCCLLRGRIFTRKMPATRIAQKPNW